MIVFWILTGLYLSIDIPFAATFLDAKSIYISSLTHLCFSKSIALFLPETIGRFSATSYELQDIACRL